MRPKTVSDMEGSMFRGREHTRTPDLITDNSLAARNTLADTIYSPKDSQSLIPSRSHFLTEMPTLCWQLPCS